MQIKGRWRSGRPGMRNLADADIDELVDSVEDLWREWRRLQAAARPAAVDENRDLEAR